MDRLMADEARSAVLKVEAAGWSVLTSGALEEGAAC
jgi:hypothetical protein